MCLFLDGKQTPINLSAETYEPFIILRNGQEFVDYFAENPLPDFISVEHDLTDKHFEDFAKYQLQGDAIISYNSYKETKDLTGYQLIKWLIYICLKKDLKLPTINVHSRNPLGSKNIEIEVNNCYQYQETRMLCGTLPLKTVQDTIILDKKEITT